MTEIEDLNSKLGQLSTDLKAVSEKLDGHIAAHEDLVKLIRQGAFKLVISVVGAAVLAGVKWVGSHLRWG